MDYLPTLIGVILRMLHENGWSGVQVKVLNRELGAWEGCRVPPPLDSIHP